MKQSKLKGLLSVAFAWLAIMGVKSVEANVSLKNGNFFIGYTDIIYPGGFQAKWERVYNSKTPYKGVQGHGWGSEYEVHLTVAADGSVVVHEYGGGAENRFTPVGFKKEELAKAIDRIVLVAKKGGALGNADQLAKYTEKLKGDAIFRNDEWEKFVRKGALKKRELAVGAQLYSNRFSYQYITRTKNGYTRKIDNGRIEKFDNGGKLSQILDKNNNFVKFTYGKDGKLTKIEDNFNRKIYVSFNNRGLLSKITGENSKVAVFNYNKKDELIYSKDVDKNEYWFKYSKDGAHNLIEIAYKDKSTMNIEYYDEKKYQNVKRVKDRDGTWTAYSYDWDKSQKGHFTVGVDVKSKSGQKISTSSYEYFMKYKPTGEEWTYRMISTIDGQKIAYTYNSCCGLPLIIKRGNSETLFEYDKKGHVTKKTTPTEITKLQYHEKFGKVTQVERFPKKGKATKKWSKFKYDKKGNLQVALNSDKKRVKLIYDRFGRIASMVDQNKRRINFKYNANSKPIEIKDPKLGTIKVSYTNSGEIKKVSSTAGRKIALQVTSAFQNLLDIIRPAGVSLSF